MRIEENRRRSLVLAFAAVGAGQAFGRGAEPEDRGRGAEGDPAKGTLIVAADATYAPNEFVASDGKTVVGMDADLAKALGG